MRWLRMAALAVAFATPPVGAANERLLTFEEALALARARAPALLSARARVAEAHGRLVGASARLVENPVLETGGGRRTVDGSEFTELEVGLMQTFELGGRRGSRMEAARAAVAGTEAASDDAERRLLLEVAVAFQRALHAGERLRLAAASEGVAAEVQRVAERRHATGDAPLLEVNLTRAAVARARADVRDREAGRAATLGRLQLLLGLDAEERIGVQGHLRARPVRDLAELLARAGERPDLREIEAAVREAEAELRLGEGYRLPDLGLGAAYEREEGASVVVGRLMLRLPFFERGQGQTAEASARASRLRQELEAARRAVASEIHTAFDVYRLRSESVAEIEREALPLLDTGESMARRAYEEGQMGLAELLLLRRESISVRDDHLDRMLEAAVAGIELEASAGALP
jgi:cobalt-zinc-cadmium efflux system outer membrane protein